MDEEKETAMAFIRIDRETWSRKEYFDHYFTQVPCTYGAVFQLDITKLRQRKEKSEKREKRDRKAAERQNILYTG